MSRLIDLTNTDAKAYFLKGSSYFRDDIPRYLSFEPILSDIATVLGTSSYRDVMVEDKSKRPENLLGVNYNFTANKDGKFAWRPYELIHPVIYVSLVNLITEEGNWKFIQARFKDFDSGVVECCSSPVLSDNKQSDKAAQIMNWWLEFEQKTLVSSLEFTHLFHTDVTDCYGSLYTHSIAQALHGKKVVKTKKDDFKRLGNLIDRHIQNSRYGQTNGICQGSVLMDFVAEMVLGYVDLEINEKLKDNSELRILRYRDDYRILANSDRDTEEALKTISDALREVGMKLGASKTVLNLNVVEGAIKSDKLAGIELRDMDIAHAKTIQKQLLRLHAFARKFPNSGALKRLASEAHEKIVKLSEKPEDIEVQVAIVTDIAMISPQAFPALAGILSHLLSLTCGNDQKELWAKTLAKLKRTPHNGYLEIWLQRVMKSESVSIPFESDEAICQIVNGVAAQLWENTWIANTKLVDALDVSKILVADPAKMPAVIAPQEVELFTKHAEGY